MILRSVTRRRPVTLAVIGALALILGARATGDAHEIPTSVTVIAYLKPEGNSLRLVARLPLEVMRDIQWPLRGPGYLELDKLGTLLQDGTKIWVIDNLKLYENGSALPAPQIRGIRISLPSDRAFESYETAFANVSLAPLPVTTDLARQQAMVDLVLDYPIASAESRFSIDPTLARLAIRLTTVLRFLPPGESERVFTYDGDPGRVHLDPNFFQAARHFIALGFAHILDGIDHLLFVLCLVIPFRRIRPLLVIVTAFTVAHSITMVGSALGFAPTALWFPPAVEVLIALSIVYTAFENIVGARVERRWMIAFGFGLIHGFGFSFALRESLQFAGSHLAVSLAAFNVGVELAQVAVLLVAVPLLTWAFRRIVAERMGTIILSALVAHTAWHWMTERGGNLGEYALTWTGAELVRVLILLVVGAAVLWYGRPLVRRALGPTDPAPPPHGAAQ
ncbi:MAG: HupE/UreJ family protein [Gemmatimonadota bacterium]|nr:HupE/UreJ family protein [Gemmatimonadota bacterium]